MDLLEQRRIVKAKKPTFMRQDSHKKGKLKNNWRRPKGSDSKMRNNKKGYRRSVRIGWRSPRVIRGLSREGLTTVIVETLKQIEVIDPKKDSIIIGSSVGLKKKLELLEAAITKGLKIHNFTDPKAYVDEQKKLIKDRRDKASEKKQQRSEKKEKAKKEAEKKAKKEDKKDDKKDTESGSSKDKQLQETSEKQSVSDGDQKAKLSDKKEKDKFLITKQ
ncbi:50S ribosomal protein L32e [Nanoarchaeota archaeon]